jgi:hypothetical protein
MEEHKLSKRDLSKLYRIRSKASRLGANQFNFDDIEKAIQLDPENKLNKMELETMKREKIIFEKEASIMNSHSKQLKLKYKKNETLIQSFYENEIEIEPKRSKKYYVTNDCDFSFD